ncbi:MAG: hypothetical protein KF795_02815 [Labilithrix sp.]|nr:hypothetical protein [Labilithrix sp.]
MRSRSSAVLALACALALTPALARAASPTEDDALLEAQRERFRAGLEKYRAGAFAEAILVWENVYRDLGPEKGYRLAFNLGRAYEQFGDSTRAAESYETYVRETARRREAGETLEPVVEKQEVEANERLAELAATQGRIRIAGERAAVVKIDGGAERLAPRTGFVAYVTPDRAHVVTFDPGTKDEQSIEVRVALGELVELAPPPPRAAPPRPLIAPPPPARFVVREERPFGKAALYVAAGATAVSVLVPVILYASAGDVRSDFDGARAEGRASAASGDDAGYTAALARADRLESDYGSARSTAYASLAIPAALGAVTLGLAAYWLFGAKASRVPVTGALLPGGAVLGSAARF